MAAIDRLIEYADLKFLVNLDFPKSENFICSNETKSNGATEIVIQKESKEDFVSRYHPFVKDAGKLTVGAQVAPSQGVTGRSNDARTNNKSRHISKVPRKTSNSKQGRPQDFGPSHSTSGQSSDSSRLSVPGIGLSDARKSLSVLPEEEMQQLNESLDLKDEETWSGYSSEEIPLRFKQYRTLALNRISELEDELDVTIRKTCTQVDSLKQQFQDQRHKWEAKQKTLVDGLKQMHALQSEAEQDIGLTLTHLDGIVNMHDNQLKDNNPLRTDDLWPVMEDISQSQSAQDAGDSEINLKEETGFVEPDRLEKMTDDAKVQMSRESTKMSSEAAKDPLITELSVTDEQQPSEDEQILYDVKPSATILSSEMVDESTSPLNLTWSKVDVDERRETLLAIRHRMEERLTKTNLFVVSSDSARASPHDELDVNNEGQVLEGDREGKGQQKIMHSQGTSPAEFINELPNDTLQPLQITPVTVLEDYLKTYDDIVTFQQNLANYLPINTSSVDRIIFNKAGPLKSQIALLSQSINKILGEIMNHVASLANSIKQNTSSNVIDQKNNQHSVHNKSLEADGCLEMEKVVSPAENMEETELRTEYMKLTKVLEQEKKLHRDQFHHNSALVSEMQDTIGNLKRELSTLRVKANGITQHHLQPPPSPSDRGEFGDPVIFTRLDSERNVKIMRKAIVEQRISVDRCKAVLHRMKRYVDLPSQRLQHLVRTYAQHKNLLEIQENLRSGDGIDSELLGLLAKMELYQKKRLEKCDEKSQALTQERARLAKELVEILSNIELESGIFLIKPVYSYKGSNDPEQSSQRKRTRPNQPNQSVKRQLQPHTTPISMATDEPAKQSLSSICPVMSVKSSDQLENGLQGTAKQLIGEPTRPVWKQSESTADQMIDSRSQPSIPHLFELDVNRVMIGNNNISVKLHPNSSSALGTSSGTRSYVAASRPNGSAIPHRSASIAGLNSVPPSTPTLYGSKSEAEGGKLITTSSSSRMSPTPGGPSLITTPPLPPIPSSKTDDGGTNVSPAGASITRHTDEQDTADHSTD